MTVKILFISLLWLFTPIAMSSDYTIKVYLIPIDCKPKMVTYCLSIARIR